MTVPANPRFYIVGRNGCKRELIDHKRKSIQIESHDATLPQPKTNSFDFPSWTTLQKYSNYRRLQEKKKRKKENSINQFTRPSPTENQSFPIFAYPRQFSIEFFTYDGTSYRKRAIYQTREKKKKERRRKKREKKKLIAKGNP